MSRRARRRSRQRDRHGAEYVYPILALLIGGPLFAALHLTLELHSYLALLLAANATAFVIYGLDKFTATRGGWRVPESALFLLVLAGGFLGAGVAMHRFRHKTQHLDFWLVLAASMAFHIVLAYFWFWR